MSEADGAAARGEGALAAAGEATLLTALTPPRAPGTVAFGTETVPAVRGLDASRGDAETDAGRWAVVAWGGDDAAPLTVRAIRCPGRMT